MKISHRKMLCELMEHCNALGGVLDGTSTNEAKYRDRQRAHSHVYKVLYAVLADHPDNDNREDDFEDAEKALKALNELTLKSYPDRKGQY